MNTQAQLYIADQRGCSQTDFFRSFHTVNFGQYVAENREPVGALQVVNDNVLMAGNRLRMQVEENTDVLIVPVMGGLEYTSEVGNGFLEAGQTQLFSLISGMEYEIANPYETETINYLEIWLRNTATDFKPETQQMVFDLSDKNKLLPLFSANGSGQPTGFIGRFDGRAEGTYQAASTDNRIFVFVLNGVFEVQNRLLHERDALSLLHVPDSKVEFEALSNDAILLVLEMSI